MHEVIETMLREQQEMHEARLGYETAVEKLVQSGYRQIGHGNYARVFARPGEDYVLKIFSTGDHGYNGFLTVATVNQHNPHFPKIRGKPIRVDNTYSAVRLEMLAPIESGMIDTLRMMHTYAMYLNGHTAAQTPEARETVERLTTDEPDIAKAIRALDGVVARGRVYWDFKPENYMRRDDTLVIVDPFDSRGAKTLPRS